MSDWCPIGVEALAQDGAIETDEYCSVISATIVWKLALAGAA
jgi:hypothetical protein